MPAPVQTFWSTKTLRNIAIGVWLAIMLATTWPLNPFPHNDVSWLADSNGVHFGKNGVVTSSGEFVTPSADAQHACSVEILLRPENATDVHTFLSFYNGGRPLSFELRQWTSVLLIFHEALSAPNHWVAQEIDVYHVFQRGKWVLITIASGAHGTRIYLNGELAHHDGGYHLQEGSLSGQLLLGAAPVNYDPWSGDIGGMAFYNDELTAADAKQHFAGWTQTGKLTGDASHHALATYLFTERGGSTIHNQAASGPAEANQNEAPSLEIPAYFQVLHKDVLTPPWREITPMGVYISDIVRNILGFVPLGIALYLYLSRRCEKRNAILLAIFLGFLSSLTIEILQVFIPQRVSGMTDIITNTLGTAAGVLLLQPRAISAMLGKFGVLAAPRDGVFANGK